MIRTIVIAVAALGAVGTAVAWTAAQDAPPAKMWSSADRMKELEWLVGTWTEEGEWPGMGKYSAEFTYQWLFDMKTYLKAEYLARQGDKVVWRDLTVLGWDEDLQKYVGFTFGMDGSLGRAICVDYAKEKMLIEGKTAGGPMAGEWRFTLTRKDADTTQFAMEMKKEGKWQSFGEPTTAKRKK